MSSNRSSPPGWNSCSRGRGRGNREQVETAFSQIRSRLGPVDLVVANAGVGKPTMLNPVNMAVSGDDSH